MDILDSYNHKSVALGTMHSKETVIGPLFKEHLGVDVVTPDNFDTDLFGTFTQDVTRVSDQQQTAVIKAKAAMELLGLDLGIASEGSFGVHPHMPFVTSNREIVVFIDTTNNLTIFGSHTQAAPYVNTVVAKNVDDVLRFAVSIDFPKHAIVIKQAEHTFDGMVKGIKDKAELIQRAQDMLAKNTTIWLETDMRAHANESRMQNIKAATVDLIDTIKRRCPSCQSPGFHTVESIPGLPCKHCGQPTDVALYDVYHCDVCQYTQKSMYPTGSKTANAQFCDYCNP